jgi:hypothetical protein
MAKRNGLAPPQPLKGSKACANSEMESDQVRKGVATEKDGSKAAADNGEKKGGCNGVFHRGHSDMKKVPHVERNDGAPQPPPTYRQNTTDSIHAAS